MRAYLVLGFALLAAATTQKAAMITTPAGTDLEKDSYIATLIVNEKAEQERLIAIFVAQCEANKAAGVAGFSKVPTPDLIRIRDAHFLNCVLTEEELDLLRDQTDLVEMVQQDPLVKSQMERTPEEEAAMTTNAEYPISCGETQTSTNPAWGHLTQGMDALNNWKADNKWDFSSGWGKSITVFVLDAGVRCTHAELKGRCTHGPVFTPRDMTTDDVTGHGTHAASMIAGKTLGIARSATIVSLKVVESVQTGATSQVIKALSYIQDQIDGIIKDPVTVYLSFSVIREGNTALHRAMVGLTLYGTANGMAIVLPAGNHAADACLYKPGNETSTITVGATNEHFTMEPYSNRGKCVDLWAHGKNTLGASGFDDHNLGPRTGTSFAAATVAGAAAALLSANVERQFVSSTSARHAMIKMASGYNLVPDPTGYGQFVQLACRPDIAPYPVPPPATPLPTVATAPPRTFAPPVPPSTGTYAMCYNFIERTVINQPSRINIMGEPQSAVGYLKEHRCWWLRCDGVATLKWNKMLVPQDERLSLWKTTGTVATSATAAFEKHWAGYVYRTDITEKFQGDIVVNWDRHPAYSSVNPFGGGFDLEFSCEVGAVLPPPPPQPTLIFPRPSCKDGITRLGGKQGGRSQTITFPRKGGNYPAGHEECWIVDMCAGPETGDEHPEQRYHFDKFRTRQGIDTLEIWRFSDSGYGWGDEPARTWSGTPETTFYPGGPRTYPQWFTGNDDSLDNAWVILQNQFSIHNETLFRFKAGGSPGDVTESGFSLRVKCIGQCHDRLLPDKTVWHDSLVDRGQGEITTCAWYGESLGPNINKCKAYGKTYPREGMTADVACCKCGGGQYEDETPVPATDAPAQMCQNLLVSNEHWVDSEGHDCEWYEGGPATGNDNRCALHGADYLRNKMTAKIACCRCGGGSAPGTTPAPTRPGYCQDKKLADGSPWKDGDLAQHDCAWYTTAKSHNCLTHGSLYERDGETASTACCGCGGGTWVEIPNIPM